MTLLKNINKEVSMNIIKDKQVSLVGLKTTERPYISKIIKKAGGKFGTSFKSSEIFVKGPYILRTNNLDEFSKNNPDVKVIPLNELYKYIGLDEQIPYVEHIYERYNMHTDDKELNFERLYNLCCDIDHVTDDGDLFFNSDFCSEFEETFIDWYALDDNYELFVEALNHMGIFDDEDFTAYDIAELEFDEIADYMCEKQRYFPCFMDLVAIALAIRHFVDPSFCVRFRIYRDKWEYRGDYPGMASSARDIPPILYWKIDNEYPCGHLEVHKY